MLRQPVEGFLLKDFNDILLAEILQIIEYALEILAGADFLDPGLQIMIILRKRQDVMHGLRHFQFPENPVILFFLRLQHAVRILGCIGGSPAFISEKRENLSFAFHGCHLADIRIA